LDVKQRHELLEHARTQLMINAVLMADKTGIDTKPLQQLSDSVFKLTFPEETKPKLLEKQEFERKIKKLSRLKHASTRPGSKLQS
jgi:hypothetical protein